MKNILGLVLLSVLVGVMSSNTFAQVGGGSGGGVCDPDIEICGPPCPPEDPSCSMPPPLDPLGLLQLLASSCQPGDLAISDIRIAKQVIASSIASGALHPRPAKALNKKLMACMGHN